MPKSKLRTKLTKPVHSTVSTVVLIIGFLGIVGGIFTLLQIMGSYQNNPGTSPASQQYQAQIMHTATPTSFLPDTTTPAPVDMSNWKTYTDWTYHFSIKVPPEFVSYIPGKGKTGDTIDPDGRGFVQFEDSTLTGSYPYTTSKYGFYVRVEKNVGDNPYKCTTDQECSYLIMKNYYNFGKPQTPAGQAKTLLIHTQILNQDVIGLATLASYYYPFALNGQPFTAEISFYYPKSMQDNQAKDPIINAILSSISINQ